jgi:hypothetical protein
MVRIAISQAAFDAIASTLPPGSTDNENAVNEKGERLIWLERRMLDKLNSYRRAGESTATSLQHGASIAYGREGWQSDRLSTRPKRPSRLALPAHRV